MSKNKRLFLDVETTGRDPSKHEPIQIACIVEIDGKIVDKINVFLRPRNFEVISKYAIEELQGKTLDQLRKYPHSRDGFYKLLKFLNKHINSADKDDKFTYVGYNVSQDIAFLCALFKRFKQKFLFSYLGLGVDLYFSYMTMVLFEKAVPLVDYKLKSICSSFNIQFDTHDAYNDAIATRELFYQLKDMLEL